MGCFTDCGDGHDVVVKLLFDKNADVNLRRNLAGHLS